MSPASMPAWLQALRDLLGERVHHGPEACRVYECDGLTLFKAPPEAVAFPESTDEVAAIVRLCNEAGVPFVPRGAGTGLSGGALALEGGVVLEMARMRRVLHLDFEHRYAVVQPGLVNIELTEAVAAEGLYYAPDPSSQMACTIGGNVAENSGGPHCLKHGMTTRHVLGATVVMPDGSVETLGGPRAAMPGYDLIGLFVGSEGTLGIATEVTVRLSPQPQAVRTFLAAFASMGAACKVVSAIIAQGLDPAALEVLDRRTIEAVEASVYAAGYPRDAEAVVLIELDGLHAEVEAARQPVQRICERHGALTLEEASDAAERRRLWKGRKGAFGAMGRIDTDLLVMDGVVPRHKLEWILDRIYTICEHHQVRVSNVFHAGDGNLHPNISYDGRDPEQRDRVLRAGEAILRCCIEAGGTLSGEHGIGIEKRDYMPYLFTDADLALMRRVRDAWNPRGLCNPGKVVPAARACVEARGRMLTLEPETSASPRPEPDDHEGAGA